MPSTRSRGRVLVVDDDEQELLALAETIRAIGYDAETARDGEIALQMLGSTQIDAVITDLMMPRVDGFELLRTLLDRGDRIPSIVLASLGSIDRAISIVHDLHAFWFLEKPASQAVLASLLERAVQHRSLVSETERLQR